MTHLTSLDRTLDLTNILKILSADGDAVIIQEEGRDIAVVLSPDDYAYLRKLQDQTDLIDFFIGGNGSRDSNPDA